jgi:hypothetical protein
MCNLHRVLFDPAKPSASALGKPTQIGDSINGLGEVHWPWYDPTRRQRCMFVSSRICENTDGCHSPDDYKQRVRFSLNGGISWTRALFPFDATHTMRFVTSESGVLLVGVRHHDQAAEAEYGDLYVSSTGAVEDGFFVRSLRHVYMSPKMWWENSMFAGQLAVERSSELDGVLIANRYRSLARRHRRHQLPPVGDHVRSRRHVESDQGAARRVLDRRLLPARAAQLERVSDRLLAERRRRRLDHERHGRRVPRSESRLVRHLLHERRRRQLADDVADAAHLRGEQPRRARRRLGDQDADQRVHLHARLGRLVPHVHVQRQHQRDGQQYFDALVQCAQLPHGGPAHRGDRLARLSGAL